MPNFRMPKTSTPDRSGRTVCEDVRFAEVEFTPPITPRLVIAFSDGLSLLLEDESAIELAAQFITSVQASLN